MKRQPLDDEETHVAPQLSLTDFYRTTSMLGKEAMWKKKANGETMHLAPLGFLNSRDADGRSITVIDPKIYPLVQEARRLRSEGTTYPEICRIMREKGLRSKRGKVIGLSSMFLILNQPPV